MKGLMKAAVVLTVVGFLGFGGAAYAANLRTPADIASELTGKQVVEVNQERAAGKTYGAIAADAGKLEEFKAQILEQKKAILQQRVSDGTLTQQQANEIYNELEKNQANCSSPGSCGLIGSRNRVGFGKGAGAGQGLGMGNGFGRGTGFGRNTGI